jgi:hypothetical protein
MLVLPDKQDLFFRKRASAHAAVSSQLKSYLREALCLRF